MALSYSISSGSLLGHFEILEAIGEGGMGIVYRARDVRLDRIVALKVLRDHILDDPWHRERLRTEAQIVAALDHPNIASLYDLLEVEGRHVLVMQYVEGDDLGQVLSRGPLPVEAALAIFTQVARGLQSAHKRGIIHRDLKPGNIKVTPEGKVRIIDFGMAASTAQPVSAEASDAVESPATAETSDRFLGTPSYMSPEQVRAEEVDSATDVWSFGCCLFHALSGTPPFQEKTLPELFVAIAQDDPDWRELPPDVERELIALLRLCLKKKAQDRIGHAGDMAVILEDIRTEREEKIRRLREEDTAWTPAAGSAIPGRDHWELSEHLGEGGFGEVWLAQHTKTYETRVFKFCNDPRQALALKREVVVFRLLREVLGRRKDILRILDWQLDRAPFYLELEHIASRDVAAWAREKGGLAIIPLATRIDIARQTAEALAAAHSAGVLHKDIKPGNILIRKVDTAGCPRITLADFGLGQIRDRRALSRHGITEAGYTEVFSGAGTGTTPDGGGTRMYMAPEIIEGKPATTQSDIYSLGVVCYQLLIGDFTRSLASGWERDIEDELLLDDIQHCVAGNPEERFTSAGELAANLARLDLRRKARQEALERQRAVEEAEALAQRLKKRRKVFFLFTVCGIVLTLAAVGLAVHESGLRAEAELSREAAEANARTAEAERRRVAEAHAMAETNFNLARNAVNEAFARVSQNVLLAQPQMQDLRANLLESLLDYYQEFAAMRADDPALRVDLAYAYFHIGVLLIDLDRPGWAGAFDHGLTIAEAALEDGIPQEIVAAKAQPIYRPETFFSNGAINAATAQPVLSAQLFVRGKNVLERYVQQYPEVLAFKSDLVMLHQANGELLKALHSDAALPTLNRALALAEELVQRAPEKAAYHAAFAITANSIAIQLISEGRDEEGFAMYERSCRATDRLVALRPDVTRYHELRASYAKGRGLRLFERGREEEAQRDLALARSIFQELVESYPGVKRYRNALSRLPADSGQE
jgi:serine/threonine protein kinase/tetratricopeptide (TPR) repeat protein